MRVAEYRPGLLEVHAMLAEIRSGLPLVPCELEGQDCVLSSRSARKTVSMSPRPHHTPSNCRSGPLPLHRGDAQRKQLACSRRRKTDRRALFRVARPPPSSRSRTAARRRKPKWPDRATSVVEITHSCAPKKTEVARPGHLRRRDITHSCAPKKTEVARPGHLRRRDHAQLRAEENRSGPTGPPPSSRSRTAARGRVGAVAPTAGVGAGGPHFRSDTPAVGTRWRSGFWASRDNRPGAG